MTEKTSPQQARQGAPGKPALYVLIASLALMAVYMVGLLTWSGSTAPPDPASQSQAASRAEVTGSTSGRTNTPSSANSAHVPIDNPAYPQPAVKGAGQAAPR